MKKLLLIDGNAIIHRAFHAYPLLKTKSGMPSNAIYGFFSMLYKSVVDFKPDYLTVCFDTPKPTFRNKLLKSYQEHRPKLAEDFKIQFPGVKEGLDQASIFRIEKDGYEADDIIGTITHRLSKEGIQILILTGDKDILQLVNNNTYVISPVTGLSTIKIFDDSTVLKKFAIHSNQIPDWKALAGDQSDNYSGAKGIGPKTAAKLLQQYSSLDNIYAKLNTLENINLKKLLLDNKKNVMIAKKLATILTDVDIPFRLEKTRFTGFNDGLKKFLEKYEMRSLVKRIYENVNTQIKNDLAKETDSKQMNLF